MSQTRSQSFTEEIQIAIEASISKHMATFTTTLTSTIASLTSEIASLKASLTQKDDRIAKLEERIVLLEATPTPSHADAERIEHVEIAQDALEQYGRRMNIRVDNVPQLTGDARESSAALEVKVLELLNAAGAPIKSEDIIRLHRLGQLRHNPRNGPDSPKCSQVIVRLNNWRARESAHLARNTARTQGHPIRQDLTTTRREIISNANETIRTWGPLGGEPVYCYANINCQITMRRGRETRRISCNDDFDRALDFFKPR